MSTTTPTIQELARRLIALEAAREQPHEVAVVACEKLRGPIAKLVGVAGFRSLLSRALAMAKSEVPSLDTAQVRPDGTLEGLEGIGRSTDAETGAVVVAQLLGLLVTFIGEPLTLGLVCDAWPNAIVNETHRRGEGQS